MRSALCTTCPAELTHVTLALQVLIMDVKGEAACIAGWMRTCIKAKWQQEGPCHLQTSRKCISLQAARICAQGKGSQLSRQTHASQSNERIAAPRHLILLPLVSVSRQLLYMLLLRLLVATLLLRLLEAPLLSVLLRLRLLRLLLGP